MDHEAVVFDGIQPDCVRLLAGKEEAWPWRWSEAQTSAGSVHAWDSWIRPGAGARAGTGWGGTRRIWGDLRKERCARGSTPRCSSCRPPHEPKERGDVNDQARVFSVNESMAKVRKSTVGLRKSISTILPDWSINFPFPPKLARPPSLPLPLA